MSVKLEITDPEESSTITSQNSITIVGETDNEASVLSRKLDNNDNVISGSIVTVVSDANGIFKITIQLDEGINNITVTAFDPTGDSRFAERSVYYSKEKI